MKDVKELIDSGKPRAYVEMERDNPPYAHIVLRVSIPSTDWNVPSLTFELTGQVGTSHCGCGEEIELYADPYAVRFGMVDHKPIDLATVEIGIKYLKAFDRAVAKFEKEFECRPSWPDMAQMLMMVCKCEYLIHEPNRGWRSGHDLGGRSFMSFRGATSKAIFKSMVATMRQYALTGK